MVVRRGCDYGAACQHAVALLQKGCRLPWSFPASDPFPVPEPMVSFSCLRSLTSSATDQLSPGNRNEEEAPGFLDESPDGKKEKPVRTMSRPAQVSQNGREACIPISFQCIPCVLNSCIIMPPGVCVCIIRDRVPTWARSCNKIRKNQRFR